MESLTEKIKNVEREEKIAEAHEEALSANKRYDAFQEHNQKARSSLVESIEGGSIVPGESMLVNYVTGCPAYGKNETARGKIVDINYNGSGEVILKMERFIKKSIPFEQIEKVEYKPEIRETREAEETRKRREEEKESRREEALNKEVLNYALNNRNLRLQLPGRILCRDYSGLVDDIKSACRDADFRIRYSGCYDPGHGRFDAVGVENDSQEVIFATGLHDGASYFTPSGVEVYVPGGQEVNMVYLNPNPFAQIAEIENKDARIFLSNLFGVWKDSPGGKE